MAKIAWIVLTMGDRPTELGAAVESLLAQTADAQIIVFANGVEPKEVEASLGALAGSAIQKVEFVGSATNLGAPGGRVAAMEHLNDEIDTLAFLDDDARLLDSAINEQLGAAFDLTDVAVVAMRLVDESGTTARRHIPRVGTNSSECPGDVAVFLAGAVAMRRSAYERAGGYWAPLVYAHEELDLAWRIIDRGGRIAYRPELLVFHPRTPISRHADGWRRTGRNRVAIARRNLPLPVMLAHTVAWLIVGTVRSPAGCRRPYVVGWMSGWRVPLDRRPIRFRTVWQLCRLGRPPII